ncbi:MAG: Mut7-C RNAse domain-containing protein [Candidatus Micrarchaeota archaeon]
MKLLFDEMLKHLASWCRLLGIDSAFYTGRSDSQLLHAAMKETRILVTRDMPLSLRCEKYDVKFIFIKSDRIEEQIAQVLKETGISVEFPNFKRCASCNGELEEASKEAANGKVPQNTLEHNERFWRCKSCGKFFWEGGHWKNIMRVYEKAKALAAL